MWSSAGFAYSVLTPHDHHDDDLDFEEMHSQQLIETAEARTLRRQLNRGRGLLLCKSRRLDSVLGSRVHQHFKNAGMGIEFYEGAVTLASLRGQRKSEARSSTVFESVAARNGSVVADASARISWIVDEAVQKAELILLAPDESLRILNAPDDGTSRRDKGTHHALVRHFSAIAQAMADAHIDFDFGDERIMARHAVVEHDLCRTAR